MKRTALLINVFAVLLCAGAQANNITTANVKLTGQNTTNKTTQIQFDVSWENSWRTSSGPANWDAAWIFVKYRVNGIGAWKPATINAAGNAAPSASISIGLLTPGTAFNASTNPGMGAFIYRSSNGSGTFTVNSAQLQWNYGVNGVGNNDLVDVQVYAIETVYVPAASYFLGSGAGSSSAFEYGSFYKYPTETVPYQVTSEAAINVGAAADQLYYSVGGGDEAGPIPALFPKGYAAFYCMKYELSQQGFADFLNNLNYPQAHLHYNYNATIGRNRFAIDTIIGSSAFISRAPYIATNFISWSDLCAYLAWAGLRPMSELEYEKACRGTLTPTPNENAWGTSLSSNRYYSITNRDGKDEYISSQISTEFGVGNVSSNNTVGFVASPTPGPLRVGIFAATADTFPNIGRVMTGATFYGIMEMSGNVWERAVTVGNAQGRSFVGSHGNGLLDANGLPTGNTDWPSFSTAIGAGQRGGSWNTPTTVDSLSVSNRRFFDIRICWPRCVYWWKGRTYGTIKTPVSLLSKVISILNKMAAFATNEK